MKVRLWFLCKAFCFNLTSTYNSACYSIILFTSPLWRLLFLVKLLWSKNDKKKKNTQTKNTDYSVSTNNILTANYFTIGQVKRSSMNAFSSNNGLAGIAVLKQAMKRFKIQGER